MIEWCQKNKYSYRIKEYKDNGNDADGQKYFSMSYILNGQEITKARATSKKKAEEKVSRRAYYKLQDQILE